MMNLIANKIFAAGKNILPNQIILMTNILIESLNCTTLQKYQIFHAGCYTYIGTFIPGADQMKRKGK